jgi:hypothetical protein
MSDLMSRPYKPDPAIACEACVFGRGVHALWCPAQPEATFVQADTDIEAALHWRPMVRQESDKLPIESAYYYRGELIRR